METPEALAGYAEKIGKIFCAGCPDNKTCLYREYNEFCDICERACKKAVEELK